MSAQVQRQPTEKELANRFKPGDGRDRTGGTVNRYKRLVRRFEKVLDNDDYWDSFELRAIAGKLAPAVEAKMFEYVAGKPKDSLDRAMGTDPAVDLAAMSSADLAARREEFSRRLLERKRLKEQMDAQKANENAERDALGVAHAS